MYKLSSNTYTTEKLKEFISSQEKYTSEYESIMTDISRKLPQIERQIDDNVLEARELLNFIFSKESIEMNYGIQHELNEFHKQMKIALDTLKETQNTDRIVFSKLKNAIEISNNTVKRIEDIYNISEELKVFAINSIVYSQKEGSKGKGYQIISGQFITMSEEIAKGTSLINGLGEEMNSLINNFLEDIETHEEFKKNHIETVSRDSEKLISISRKSVENFSMILNDLLSRIEAVKKPTFNIMVQLQNQDIIQQQMDHLSEVLHDIVRIIAENRILLNLNPSDNFVEEKKEEFLNISTLLKFLLITTEKQMYRINREMLRMIDKMEAEFSIINRGITDVNLDKNHIGQLVISRESENAEGSIIHLIFQAPKKTINEIILNLETGQKQKKTIISHFSDIHELVLSEKKITTNFIPIIESINNLLLLARIEQARNNLNISGSQETGKGVFSKSAFSDLSSIIEDMDNSGDIISENLEMINSAFAGQREKYNQMKLNLNESSSIIENTEKLFTDNYNSVMQITDTLASEISAYSLLFSRLRELHSEMDKKIQVCTEIRVNIEDSMDFIGGAISLNDCSFKDTTIQKILEKLTVEEERTTIAEEFSELNIEKSTGNSITLF